MKNRRKQPGLLEPADISGPAVIAFWHRWHTLAIMDVSRVIDQLEFGVGQTANRIVERELWYGGR